MKRWIAAVTAAACVAFPTVTGAQPAAGGAPGGLGGPPPAMRATTERILGEARAAATDALTPDHRTAVTAITDQAAARTLDPRTAADRIDGLLSPAERTRLLAIERKLEADMRAARGDGPPSGRPPGDGGGLPGFGPPPGGPPGALPGASPSGGSPAAGGRFAGRDPDPGRFLMMLSRARRFHGPEPRSTGAP